MKTEHLEEFVFSTSCSSLRQAAEGLFISHAALISHLNALEEELGFALFERKGELRLTEPGAIFFNALTPLLDEGKELIEQCRAVAKSRDAVRIMTYNLLMPKERSLIKDRFGEALATVDSKYEHDIVYPLKEGQADAIISIDRFSSDEVLEIHSLGFEVAEAGTVPFAVVMERKLFDSSGGNLTLAFLLARKAFVPVTKGFDRWQATIKEVLGIEGGHLPVKRATDLSFESVGLINLGESYLIQPMPAAQFTVDSDSDLVAVDEMDGRKLELDRRIIWKADLDGRIDTLMRALAEAIR